MYWEEEESTKLPVETSAERHGGILANRAETDGRWGIWGHELEDLRLTCISYSSEDKTINLGVDSLGALFTI